MSSAGQQARDPLFWISTVNQYVERYFSGPPVGHGTLHTSEPPEPSPTHTRTATMGPSSSSVMPTQTPQAKRSLPYHPERYVYARSEGVSSVHSGSAISDVSQGMSRGLAQTLWPDGRGSSRRGSWRQRQPEEDLPGKGQVGGIATGDPMVPLLAERCSVFPRIPQRTSAFQGTRIGRRSSIH